LGSYRVEEIAEGVWLLRVNDRMTQYFESLWEIPEGITYNAYLIDTGEGSILVDGWKHTFSASLIEALESLTGPDRLRYVVVNHLEPDHSGSLEDVLRWAPRARVVGSRMAARILAGSYPRARERFQPVRDGDSLRLGWATLRFYSTPWVHWPETMVTWLEERGILFTCDAFGGFGIPEGVFDDECARETDIMRSMKKYLVTVVGHYRKFITKALDKLEKEGVKPRIIAPGHGLLWRGDPGRVMSYYKSLAHAEPQKGKILALYASMYGTLEQLSRALACELRKKGYKPIVYGFTDTTRPNISDILTDAIDAEKIIIAAPTYEAGVFPYMKFIAEELCHKAAAEKDVYVLSTYGWGGIAGKKLREILESCGFRVRSVIEEQAIAPREGLGIIDKIRALVAQLEEVVLGEG